MNHIQIYDNALSKESCHSIIKYLNNHPDTEKGHFKDVNGFESNNRGIKNTNDLQFSYSVLRASFNSLPRSLNMLIPTLVKGITDYKKKFSFLNELTSWDLEQTLNIQKFDGEKDGYFMRHCEADGSYVDRMLTWMIYLNDAKCGTRFYHPR